eukprot:COSAG05_NODE_340_length_11109_cov_150.755041_8_plen_318_part_00
MEIPCLPPNGGDAVRRLAHVHRCFAAAQEPAQEPEQEPEPPMLLLHVPHASTHVPADALQDFVVTPAELRAEQLRMVDWHTDELYLGGATTAAAAAHPGCGPAVVPVGRKALALVARVSRVVVDVERFSDDEQEPSAQFGMGATYVATTEGGVLRKLTPGRRDELMAAHYWPHHAMLDTLAGRCLEQHGRCLILDCHSFPSKYLPLGTYGDGPLPEICIGTDLRHTSAELQELAVRHFREAGFLVAINTPFAGALVPNSCFGSELRVQSVMVEVRRDLYMDETTGAQVEPGFGRVQETLQALISKLEKLTTEESGGQ